MKLSQIILCTALLTTLVSCGENSSKTPNNNNAAAGGGGTMIQPAPEAFTETAEKDIKRECSASEAQALKSFEQLVQGSNAQVDAVKGKKSEKAITDGVTAIRACDEAIQQVSAAGACHLTKETVAGKKVSYYDGYRIDQKCKKTEKYLVANNARPSKNSPQPPVIQPPPVVIAPTEPPPVVVEPPPVAGGPLRQCSKDEFSNLSSAMSSVDLATKQIAKMGESASWKYDSDAISNASLGAKDCETLISYHDQNPCERTIEQADGSKVLRQYTGASLRQRCEKARTYFYEFVQNKTTLIFKNADLLLDVSAFSTKSFEADYINEIQGCRVENKSGHPIDYSSKGLVLVKDSRGFDAKMMVLETNEGLTISCYGLNIDGPFSKREVVRVLREEGTNMPLVYRLK